MTRLILLTNDDGIEAPGLKAVRRRLLAGSDLKVLVVAPDRERSGAGHAITLRRPLHVEEHHFTDLPGPAWSVAGTPADCVKVGIKALLEEPPDLVIAGINRGANLGTDVFCSGTVSAAVEGAILGVPALAVSLNAYDDPDFELAARVAERLAGIILERGLPPGTVLNVNVPDRRPGDTAGFALTRLGGAVWMNQVERRVDASGQVHYWLASEPDGMVDEPGTDHFAVSEGRISITPIHIDLTSHPALDILDGWELEAAWRSLAGGEEQ